MININFLENSGFFKIKTLEAGELLFDEGDIDNNLYIVKSGELSIEKYTTNEKKESKILAVLGNGEIFGEGSIGGGGKKQVKILANKKTVLLLIEATNGFEKFLLKHTKHGVDLLSSIIYISNKRLLESNFLLTSSYKINKDISEINDFNNRSLFNILDEISKIIFSDYVLYFEKNPVLNNIFTLKYDSRNKGKMGQDIIDLKDFKFNISNLKKQGVNLSKNNILEELKNGNEIIGYLVIGNEKNDFDESQKKSIGIISVSIAGFIKQKQYFEENRDKEYIK
ncbi:MAG: cyclic nucleotide-binding domain-containing protein [Candidatus Gracilibacteria bacterium]|nr:cyclic nucleotide-binding domain-containing protein [Candidatus Gracilibacteria bacterium]